MKKKNFVRKESPKAAVSGSFSFVGQLAFFLILFSILSLVFQTESITPAPSSQRKSEKIEVYIDKSTDKIDETDNGKAEVSFIDEDSDYIRVAGGKILNRTNCTYRKKLNSKKIDPISVISTEPIEDTTKRGSETGCDSNL